VLIKYALQYFNVPIPDLFDPLKILGLIGLMMIVLEGALDLKLKREKWRMILTSLTTAFVILGLTSFFIGGIIWNFIDCTFYQALLYAIPLSTVSSAIVIPSVHHLMPDKKEYLVYESTFSDIIGIMAFDFMVYVPDPGTTYAGAISINILISVFASIILSYILVVLFQKIKSNLKIFLFLSILALLFSIGKLFHFSALLIILIFGLVLYNHKFFFRGVLKKLIEERSVRMIRKDFRLITEESSFLILTFFFVVFGMTMDLTSLGNPLVIFVGVYSLIVIYLIRLINLKVFHRFSIFPEISIAPRGLVTILLFIRIPERYYLEEFDPGIILFIIISTSLIMMLGLVFSGHDEKELSRPPVENGQSEEGQQGQIEQPGNDSMI